MWLLCKKLMYCTCWLRGKNSWGPPLFTFLLGNNDVEGVHFRIKVLIGWLWLIAVKQKRKEQYLFHVSMNWTQLRSVTCFWKADWKWAEHLVLCPNWFVTSHGFPTTLRNPTFWALIYSCFLFGHKWFLKLLEQKCFSEWILWSQWFLRQPLEDSQKQRAPEWRPHCLEACEWLSECQQPAKQLRP